MTTYPFGLVDAHRLEAFARLGRGLGGPPAAAGREHWVDAAGVPWAAVRTAAPGAAAAELVVGLTTLGSGWVFDPDLRADWRGQYDRQWSGIAGLSPAEHVRALDGLIAELQIGPLAAKTLWVIHRAVLATRRPRVELSLAELAREVWRAAPPRNWRRDLGRALNAVTFLHLADAAAGERPALGTGTALVLVADTWSTPGRAEVRIGPGFLGW